MTRAEGVGFARTHGCLFLEVSAKSRQGVQEAFAELVQRVRALCSSASRAGMAKHSPLAPRRQVVESPALLAETSGGAGSKVRLDGGAGGSLASACSC